MERPTFSLNGLEHAWFIRDLFHDLPIDKSCRSFTRSNTINIGLAMKSSDWLIPVIGPLSCVYVVKLHGVITKR